MHVTAHDDQLVAARAAAATNGSKPTAGACSPWPNARSPGPSPAARRVRYRGIRRNQLGLSVRVAAVNVACLLYPRPDRQRHRLGQSPAPGRRAPGMTRRAI